MSKSVWTEKAKDFVKKEFIGWLDFLNLQPMVTRYEWKEEDEPDRQDRNVLFKVFGDWPYREARLHCFPMVMKAFNRGKDGEETLSLYLLHEAFHVLLRPMTEHRLAPQNFYSDMEEMTVELLTHYVWGQRKYDEQKDELIRKLSPHKNH